MTIQERFSKGEVLVPNLRTLRGDEYALKVGDNYNFNFLDYKVIEIGDGDLKGMVWIAMEK